MVFFCFPNHAIEIESTWPTTKNRGRKSFDMWYYTVTCAMLLILFFFQNILKSKGCDQSIQASKKLFCHVMVNNYLCNISWKFLIKIKSMWRCELKEQVPQLTLLYHGKTLRSSQQRCCIRKLFLKFCTRSCFRPATLLKRDPNRDVFLCILQTF